MRRFRSHGFNWYHNGASQTLTRENRFGQNYTSSVFGIAGGITFLALAPNGKGLFAAVSADNTLPLFTVIPYIQPGSASTLAPGQDTLVVAWQTEFKPAQFEVRYGATRSFDQTATVTMSQRSIAVDKPPKGGGPFVPDPAVKRLNYSALLTGLELGKQVHYQVMSDDQVIAEGYATARKPRGSKSRFVAFGDNSFGDISDRMIAFHAYEAHPDFVMNTGDNVYDSGLDNEYARYFFPVYNADVAGPHLGAPLLRSVPFYAVIGNHDVHGKALDGRAAADFNKNADALAYYTAMFLPSNGPEHPASATPYVCDDQSLLVEVSAVRSHPIPPHGELLVRPGRRTLSLPRLECLC